MHAGLTGFSYVVVLLVAVPALAQRQVPEVTPTDWHHGSTVSVEGGVVRATSSAHPLLGGALGWEMKPRLALEGSGRWLGYEGDATGFGAALSVKAGARRADVSPFVEAGFGLLRVSGTGADLPSFYRRRVSDPSTLRRSTFTDPAWHLGGGINVFVSRRLAVQPAIDLMLVRGDGEGTAMGLFMVRAVYHFEDHLVTPSRRHR